MPTTTELTEKYISEHSSIKDCLKKGLINYSALSRMIAEEIKVEKQSTKDAILIAARRFKDKIRDEVMEDKVLKSLKESNIEIKNNIFILTIEKNIYPDSLIDIEREIKKNKDMFFAIEGTKTITLIFQKRYSDEVSRKFKNSVIEKKDNLSLINVVIPKVGDVPGITSYITGMFAEKFINIEELMSCYEDTLILIKSEDVGKAMEFLSF